MSYKVLEEALLDLWTPELAWWLGILWGDGNIHYSSRFKIRSRDRDKLDKPPSEVITARVSAVGDRTTMERWFRLICKNADIQEIKASPGTFVAFVDSISFTKKIMSKFGFDGKSKSDCLKWPEELPKEFNSHFIRGLWDSDGSIQTFNRPQGKGNPTVSMSFGVKTEAFVRRVRDVLKEDIGAPDASTIPGNGVYSIIYRSDDAIKVGLYLYGNAPEHIRNDLKYHRYLDICEIRNQVKNKKCTICGNKASRGDYCETCWRARRPHITGNDLACKQCGKLGVTGQGLCAACYTSYRRSDPGWVRKSTGICVCGRPSFRKGKCDACYSRDRRSPVKELSPDVVDAKLAALDKDSESYVFDVVRLFKTSSGLVISNDILFNTDTLSSVLTNSPRIENGTIIGVPVSVGQGLCKYFTNDVQMMAYNSESGAPFKEAIKNDKILTRAVKLQLRYGDPVTVKAITRAVKYILRAPTNMPPALARWIMQRYALADQLIFDPCAGFGGRLLGAAAAKLSYKAVDVSPLVVDRLRKFVDFLKEKDPDARLFVQQGCSEELEHWEECGLVLTSPPYFNAEVYEGVDQSASKYPDYLVWRDRFLSQLVDNAAKYLVSGGRSVFVVRDVKRGKLVYPIEADLIRFHTADGRFRILEDLQIRLPGHARPERLLAFEKIC